MSSITVTKIENGAPSWICFLDSTRTLCNVSLVKLGKKVTITHSGAILRYSHEVCYLNIQSKLKIQRFFFQYLSSKSTP